MDDEEIEARVTKYLTEERMRQVQCEEQEDLEVMLQENPPLPEEQALAEQAMNQPVAPRKVKVIAEEDIILGE